MLDTLQPKMTLLNEDLLMKDQTLSRIAGIAHASVIVSCLLFLFSLSACRQNEEQLFPNIIFIYADDLGWGDLSCYGADSIHTPNLDRMAREGARFTRFYSTSSVCTPSRAGLLTGRYPVRSGLTHVLFPNSAQGIDSSEYTMAEMLKDRRYATACIGKWHLGHLPPHLPTRHGFDYYFGIPYSNDMEWEPRGDPPLPLMRNEELIDAPAHQPTLTQRYTTEALKFILENQDRPFFLYLPHTFPHEPLYASAQFQGESPYGLYGDVVMELDHSVGVILDALRQYGLEERTMVVFSSDNGAREAPQRFGDHESCGSSGPFRGAKAMPFEGGHVVPTLAWWPGQIPGGQIIRQPAIMTDWLPTFAALSGAGLPADHVPDGENILPLLRGEGERSPPDFYLYHRDKLQAHRYGRWKLIRPWKGRVRGEEWDTPELLFDLEEDPYETTNLVDSLPDVAAQMRRRMEVFENELGETPAPKRARYER